MVIVDWIINIIYKKKLQIFDIISLSLNETSNPATVSLEILQLKFFQFLHPVNLSDQISLLFRHPNTWPRPLGICTLHTKGKIYIDSGHE